MRDALSVFAVIKGCGSDQVSKAPSTSWCSGGRGERHGAYRGISDQITERVVDKGMWSASSPRSGSSVTTR